MITSAKMAVLWWGRDVSRPSAKNATTRSAYV